MKPFCFVIWSADKQGKALDPMTFENGPVEVDEAKPIWRYVGLPALLVYLEGNLRLQSVDSLKRIDPAEGIPLWDDVTQSDAFEKEEREELWGYVYSKLSPKDQLLWNANASSGHHIANQGIVFEEWRHIVNRTRYAICFIESPHESMAMWRLFAPHGFSIIEPRIIKCHSGHNVACL